MLSSQNTFDQAICKDLENGFSGFRKSRHHHEDLPVFDHPVGIRVVWTDTGNWQVLTFKTHEASERTVRQGRATIDGLVFTRCVDEITYSGQNHALFQAIITVTAISAAL